MEPLSGFWSAMVNVVSPGLAMVSHHGQLDGQLNGQRRQSSVGSGECGEWGDGELMERRSDYDSCVTCMSDKEIDPASIRRNFISCSIRLKVYDPIRLFKKKLT